MNDEVIAIGAARQAIFANSGGYDHPNYDEICDEACRAIAANDDFNELHEAAFVAAQKKMSEIR